jgi:arylsulfatase A-like enzyme
MKWTGHLEAGKVYTNPVSSMDIFMTAVNLAECPLPDDRIYDGVNLLPYVTGQDTSKPHDVFYWKADHIHAMRRGNWKFLLSTRDNWVELYNISEDRYEQYDLNQAQPDTLIELQKEYQIWKEQQAPPLWPRIMDHKFIIDDKVYWFPA